MEYYYPYNADMNRLSEQNLTMQRFGHASVLMADGRILIAGGISRSSNPLSSTEVFDPYTRRFESGPQLEEKRSFAAAALLNNSVYICGGSRGFRRLSSCERLSATDSTQIQPMNESRSSLAMVAFKNKLYAFGGLDVKERVLVWLSSVESYEPNKDLWSYAKPMSIPRVQSAASVLGNRIFVCGGLTNGDVPLKSCERYDRSENKWETIANMTKARRGHRLVTVNGRIFALGGYPPEKSVEMYDPINDEWSSQPQLIQERSLFSGVVLPGMFGNR